MDIDSIIRECQALLPCERGRLDSAMINLDYYHGDNEKHIEPLEAEDPLDYQIKQKRCSQICQRVINVLTEHLYNPGPSRIVPDDEGANDFLGQVYNQNDINSLFKEADAQSTLNEVSALRVTATGEPDCPIKIDLWGADQFAVFEDPNDCTKVMAVVTLERYDEQTRIRLWTADTVYTFMTQKVDRYGMNGRTAALIATEENPIGTIPFTFIHYSRPTRSFWTPSPGTALRKANARIDFDITNIENAKNSYIFPKALAVNLDPNWRGKQRFGDFLHLPSAAGKTTDGKPLEPKLFYLQADLDIAGFWADTQSFIERVLMDHGVPKGSITLQASETSGIQILLEQSPLLTRAKSRQTLFSRYENQLARLVFLVAGYSLSNPQYLNLSNSLSLSLNWPEPSLSLPGPERDTADQFELSNGLVSKVQLVMKRYNLTREQALAHLQQVDADNAALTTQQSVSNLQ